jgi:hypothetical protein
MTAQATPMGQLAELILMAKQMKALFDSFVEAGFSEDQALKLVCAALGGQR